MHNFNLNISMNVSLIISMSISKKEKLRINTNVNNNVRHTDCKSSFASKSYVGDSEGVMGSTKEGHSD